MTEPAHRIVAVDIVDGVARITMNHGRVNALGRELRGALGDALERLAGDPAVTAVLLLGQPQAFSAGADITEFNSPEFGTPGRYSRPAEPDLGELVALVEEFPKPVIAGITGVALGGGLELAMAAHARIAAPTARLGLPEITLGLLPGAGGTGRLPRLVGPERALEMILTGKQVSASEALRDGLVDALIDDPGSPKTVRWAADFVATRTAERTRDRAGRIAEAAATPGTVRRLSADALRKAKDPYAAQAAIEAMATSIEQSFDRGADVERTKFEERLKSPESAAQRHLFTAERAARKPADLSPDAARTVRRAGVIGAGTMGGGIAMALAGAAIPVTVVEAERSALDRGLAQIEKNLAISVSRGSRTQDDAARLKSLITGSLDYADLADADLVIEAAFEDLQVKQEIFATLDRHVRPDCVLASNTSYLSIDGIAAETRLPGRVLGLHFFSPANVMPLVEVVRGAATDTATLATGFATARRMGKTPVVVRVCHGFVGNRMLEVRSLQAEQLLLEGALPGQVDRVLKGFGFRMGSFEMGDMAGLDIGWRSRKAEGRTALTADALCEAGRFGQKTGAGYYAYAGRERRDDPEVEQLILDISRNLGISRREISDREILERLLFPMINEGARILDEGIAERAGDIDVIWAKGYNWPAYRGGPMWYAGHVGTGYVAERLRFYAEQTADVTLLPAGFLAEAAHDVGSAAGLRG
ncbi:3-hydroxyacyl-CoA dehydrogenase NAD-binding domain-containing protein [Arthrobacter sp. fls2-241-R2A-200]|uniref:3-hydroxyacyl-CoA dehydrogenase NAD-binding domain-containing protein n=1 Tax=Arthrobacter sp. fls2-241-R2A-200 TaxID=3040281 RepID=UPI0025507D7E|nr:3-hydroxyacyl-CoA dehydrogenase NAD-binding domain-containing protein [Arthrobacter sp. fls2-241-R2A-200]